MDAARSNVVTGGPDLGGIREQVRARRRAVSVPLLFTGAAITAVTVRDLVVWSIVDHSGPDESGAGVINLWPVWLVLWFLVPASFVAVWWFRRRTWSEQGVGVTRPSGAAAGVVAALLVLPPYLVLTFFTRTTPYASPFVAFALGLLAIGLAERTPAVWAWALGVGVPGSIEAFYGLTNRLPQGLWFEEAHDLILVALAVLTFVAGAVAWRRENRVLSTR